MHTVRRVFDTEPLARHAGVGGGAVFVGLQIWKNSEPSDAPWMVAHPLPAACVAFLVVFLCFRLYWFIRHP